MAVDLELAPKTKRPAGERCCEPVVYPDVEREHAVRMAAIAKALGDPIRAAARRRAAQARRQGLRVRARARSSTSPSPRLSHHLKTLREAGIVDSERRGLWAYYYVLPDALEELTAWLS